MKLLERIRFVLHLKSKPYQFHAASAILFQLNGEDALNTILLFSSSSSPILIKCWSTRHDISLVLSSYLIYCSHRIYCTSAATIPTDTRKQGQTQSRKYFGHRSRLNLEVDSILWAASVHIYRARLTIVLPEAGRDQIKDL